MVDKMDKLKLNEMYNESIRIWGEVIGKQVKTRYKLVISDTKRKYGVCKHRLHEIHLSEYALSAMPPEKTMNTLLHEVLHMIFPGEGHKGNWLKYSNKFNKTNYSKLYGEIKRTTEHSEELKEKIKQDSKYLIVCTNKNCGIEFHRLKESKLVTHTEKYHCGTCGSKLERKR